MTISIDQTIDTLLSKLTQVAETHGAEAIDLGGWVLQMQAAQSIIWPVVVAGMCILLGYKLVLPLFKQYKETTEEDIFDDRAFACLVATIIAFMLLGIVLIISLFSIVFNTLNPVYWAAVFDPRFALAAKILGYL